MTDTTARGADPGQADRADEQAPGGMALPWVGSARNTLTLASSRPLAFNLERRLVAELR